MGRAIRSLATQQASSPRIWSGQALSEMTVAASPRPLSPHGPQPEVSVAPWGLGHPDIHLIVFPL